MHVRCGNSIMSCVENTFVPSSANRLSGLGKGENPMLNIAFQQEAEKRDKPSLTESARSFSNDETQTSQTTITTALKLRGSLDGNR